MKDKIKRWYAEVSKTWLVVFVLSVISTILYCFIGIPMMEQSSGGDVWIYRIWSTLSMALAIFSEYVLVKPFAQKMAERSYSQKVNYLMKTNVSSLFGLLAIIILFASIDNPTQMTQRGLAALFIMISGLTAITFLGVLILFIENKIQTRLNKTKI